MDAEFSAEGTELPSFSRSGIWSIALCQLLSSQVFEKKVLGLSRIRKAPFDLQKGLLHFVFISVII